MTITITLDGTAVTAIVIGVVKLLIVFGLGQRRGCGCGVIFSTLFGVLMIAVGVTILVHDPFVASITSFFQQQPGG